MTDPFEALRTAPTPIDPEPAFAARLRARLLHVLQPSQGDQSMTLQTPETADRLRQGDLSHFSLWVRDVARAATFFSAVLGWRYGTSGPDDSRLVEAASTSLGISELRGASAFMRQMGMPLPDQLEPTTYPVFVVDDITATVQRVRAAGGWAGEPVQQPYGLVAACTDDQGLPFSVHQAPTDMPAPRPPASGGHHGDIAYLAFETPDVERGRAFLGAALGLQFSPGRTPGGWNITDMVPMAGLSGGHQ